MIFEITLEECLSTDKLYDLDKNYVHTQNEPAKVWYVQHNLTKHPSISIVDDNNKMIFGDIKYDGENSLRIIFSTPQSGKAFLN